MLNVNFEVIVLVDEIVKILLLLGIVCGGLDIVGGGFDIILLVVKGVLMIRLN